MFKMKSWIVICLSVCIMINCIGCSNKETYNNQNNMKLETIKDSKIEFSHSDLADLYLIATALYFDFQSDNLISNQNELEQSAQDFFSQYKDHPFIVNLGDYIDMEYNTFRFGTIVPLIEYCYWDSEQDISEELVCSDVFENKAAFDSFLQNLEKFYQDTNAEQFFRDQQKYETALASQLTEKEKIFDESVYLSTMENYVGNKVDLYGETPIEYNVFYSFYLLNNASFFQMEQNNTIEFICFTATHNTDTRNKADSFDVGWMLDNAIHEYLHMYINKGVEEQDKLIQSSTSDKNVNDYVGELYNYMPWNRIIDENIVRAVQTRIYSEVLGDEAKAYAQILEKEVKWGGFQKVQKVYDALEKYETNRTEYKTIDDYMPLMIEALFN